MSQVVLQLRRTPVVSPETPANSDTAVRVPSREVAILGAVLALIQILDGYLTAVGVYHFGTEIEGNALLRSLMETYGLIATLVVAKTLAIGIIAVLCSLTFRVWWLKRAMYGIAALYLVCAIIPWCVIVSQSIL